MLSGQRPSEALIARVSGCIGYCGLDLFDNGPGMTTGDHDPSSAESRHRHLQSGAGFGRGLLPSGSLQHASARGRAGGGGSNGPCKPAYPGSPPVRAAVLTATSQASLSEAASTPVQLWLK